jgi:hypothetical protein
MSIATHCHFNITRNGFGQFSLAVGVKRLRREQIPFFGPLMNSIGRPLSYINFNSNAIFLKRINANAFFRRK